MGLFPEHDKLKLVQDDSQMIGEFLDWANHHGYITQSIGTHTLLAKFFGIDEAKLEDEKDEMLKLIQQFTNE